MTTPTRVTKEALRAKIAVVDYAVMPGGRTTICQLTMQNGFTVRGESNCMSAENFNKELGENYAYEKAFDAAWAFEGYLLAESRHREDRGDENRHREEQEKARRDVLLALMEMLMVSDTDALLRRVTDLREAYTVLGSFGWALERLNEGSRVARAGWNGKDMWLMKIQGSNDIASLHGYGFGEYLGEPTFTDTIYLKNAQNQLVAWNPSQTDMLTEDWEEVL